MSSPNKEDSVRTQSSASRHQSPSQGQQSIRIKEVKVSLRNLTRGEIASASGRAQGSGGGAGAERVDFGGGGNVIPDVEIVDQDPGQDSSTRGPEAGNSRGPANVSSTPADPDDPPAGPSNTQAGHVEEEEVIVLDESEDEAQDSANNSFLEEVGRDLGTDPQNFRALLPLLRSSVPPIATLTPFGPFIRAMITRDRDIDPVEDYRGNASTPQGQPDPAPAAHVPQEESLEVTIEYEELHELLGDSNDTTTTLDEGDEVQDSGNNTIDLTEDEVVAPVAPSAGPSTASTSYTLSYTCPICMDSYQSLTNRGNLDSYSLDNQDLI